ncbi:MAG: ATP-binding response regulator [Janthinobacterium lividum]
MSDAQRNVLVIDDREENRYTLRHTLERAGFRITEAATGKQALEKSRELPDVIVLDVRLPDILGYEVCRRLKANPQTGHIPVLQLSAAFTTTESKLYALESGADSYLIQPADPLVLVATVRSLLRLHEAEKRSRSAAQQWAATFDALSEGVAIIRNDVVERCNRAMTLLLGVSYGQIEGQYYGALLQQHFSVTEALPAEGASCLVRVEHRFFQLSTSCLPADGGTAGCMLIVADVTRQKQAEEALLLNERLAATGRLAHTIAHEINNPLEAITNLIYLVQGSPSLEPEASGYLESAAGEVERVSQIARQILSFHRETREAVDVPISELVRDVLELSARAASEKKLTVDAKITGDFHVLGYPSRLRQVFANIIRNAIEAAPAESTLCMRIHKAMIHRHGQNPVPAIRVSVFDQGEGIPAAIRTRIFEPFFTTKGERGSGVGLWLTATIVEEHQGKLQLRSRSDSSRTGSCFSVLLPQFTQE